ncbi:uncharacterized protein EV422DRAFT_566239 [Fimicolochytrium jonesii]|uniref:uncharacterized protein n=1 Tax=Fimicolochytrium jonesii TaxID=1396493 RepID=UPI0022FDCCC8|nr:uncharacterized protein EV422DRAFT_566239 [Fimicolochytrium jonesii]KAI8822560.1 hypothetical protein EV422DRAFT_566239 [Fimicolochytrium jonesii]
MEVSNVLGATTGSTDRQLSPGEFFSSDERESKDDDQIKAELHTYLAEYLCGCNKNTWITKLRNVLRSIPDQLLPSITVKALISSAPVFSVWSSDVSQTWSRKLLSSSTGLATAPGSTFSEAFATRKQCTWSSMVKRGMSMDIDGSISREPLYVLSRTEATGRECMATNISEAKERGSYHEIKKIATWYLTERTNGNLPALDEAAEYALQMQGIQEQREQDKRREDRKRKLEEREEGEKKTTKRAKHLRMPAEEVQHRKEKAERREKNPTATPVSKKSRANVAKEKQATKRIRAISFRFYPRPELESTLSAWLRIADFIDDHVKEVLD